MEKKKAESKDKSKVNLMGDDYPFEMEEEDYVPMVSNGVS